jgi:hypothetical protein
MLRNAQQLQTEESAFERRPQDKKAVHAWLAAAQDKWRDSDNSSVSIGTRFEAAYDAVFFVALAVLNAAGWKARAVDGHHAYALEAACAAVGAGEATFDRLDAIREVRNQKYAGVGRTDADLRDARIALNEFSAIAGAWMSERHPTLLK